MTAILGQNLKNKYKKATDLFQTISKINQGDILEDDTTKKVKIIDRRLSTESFYDIDSVEKVEKFINILDNSLKLGPQLNGKD